jgi:glycosyltransferase involved in cell wall biosynthesis
VPAPVRSPLHVVQVLGGGSAGTGSHVRSLTAGLVARGLSVTVCAPPSAERRYGFTAAGARFVPVPVQSRVQAAGVLRVVCAGADLVHAHGMRAGLLASLALRRRRVPLVVSWHARSAVPGVRARVRPVTEWWVARAASVVLGATSDLVDRARRRGARDARLAPEAPPAGGAAEAPGSRDADPQKARAELGAVDRPLLVAAGLDGPRSVDVLLSAARAWRDVSPRPLLVVAAGGARGAAVRRRADREDLPVHVVERPEDAARLVPVADVAVLVPYGRPAVLGAAVAGLLADPARRVALADAGRVRAGSWPTVETTVAQVLSVYDELAACPAH